MVTSFTLPSIPVELHWKNQPLNWEVKAGNELLISAGAQMDWFIDPTGTLVKKDAPVALFTPPDHLFTLQAKVTVDFRSKYDAGVLFAYVRDDLWAKLCFEFSPQNQPMVVSVVTRGVSDDCNSTIIESNTIYYRIYHNEGAWAYHYSKDGSYWHLVRHFSLGSVKGLQVGFSAQSPTGQGCKVVFSEISYIPRLIADLRSGE